MIEKRKRGRPPNTGIDDSAHLKRIAELMIATPGLLPTTAMHRVIRGRKWPASDKALVRRWQKKWQTEGERYLAEARQAHDARLAQAARSRENVPARGGSGDGGYVASRLALNGMSRIDAEVNRLREIHRATHDPLSEMVARDMNRQAAIDRAMDPVGTANKLVQDAMRLQTQALGPSPTLSDALARVNTLSDAVRGATLLEDALRPLLIQQRLFDSLKPYGW